MGGRAGRQSGSYPGLYVVPPLVNGGEPGDRLNDAQVRPIHSDDERFPGLDAELLVGGGEVGLHGLDTQKQLLGDRAVRGSGGRQLTHLPLPGRE